ncbi:Metallo-dependent hydrolase [Eremomyces bilateralis CBS 781.70]|uniref:Metallo-dependent hydrolase n=1 Tax=Eremomyces bilateralis CBS 781.70 TaxID=1392243 RepID=A0A6G1G0Y7_9PEZI|nr:Metallo-dependent hydrolase [Eremomyces bilateralis CBS 781.70]KAF1811590.1 Metallo-dependent hydrolase [Eremomyces bilateralis CBS 781.70]
MSEFPWHLGVYDAHCHPTDTMSSIPDIPNMKAKALTIMATRGDDQRLVSEVTEKFGGEGRVDDGNLRSNCRVVPSYGWHPWFSHQIYDDAEYEGSTCLNTQQKVQHYQSVLNPKPEDEAFVTALPDPEPLSQLLDRTRAYLERDPSALLGEVGLDKSFRLPEAWFPDDHQRDGSLTPGGREGRKLSLYRVSMEHQRRLLKAQLGLAGRLGRAASVHGVQAHGVLYETFKETWKGHERKHISKREKKRQTRDQIVLDTVGDDDRNLSEDARGSPSDVPAGKPFPPRVCLHSYSGNPQSISPYLHPSVPIDFFFSFSAAINFSMRESSKTEDAIRAVPDGRLLVESDLHTAGNRMDDHLEQIVRIVCKCKGWELEQGIERLGRNWQQFVFGSDESEP